MSDRRMSVLKKIARNCVISTTLFWNDTPCYIWRGGTSGQNGRGHGYPRMSLNAHTVAVHLVIYTHFYGYIPGNRTVDHTCKNRLCINPYHLSLVSSYENARRRDGKAPRHKTEHGNPVPEHYAGELAQFILWMMGNDKPAGNLAANQPQSTRFEATAAIN